MSWVWRYRLSCFHSTWCQNHSQARGRGRRPGPWSWVPPFCFRSGLGVVRALHQTVWMQPLLLPHSVPWLVGHFLAQDPWSLLRLRARLNCTLLSDCWLDPRALACSSKWWFAPAPQRLRGERQRAQEALSLFWSLTDKAQCLFISSKIFFSCF